MSTTIDNRVVSLEFDNAQFEREARTTLNSLQKLDDSINYNGMQGNLQAIADRFSTLGIVGMTVTQNLTNTVLDGAKQILHGVNMVFDQIEQGGKRRAMNIEQAKFQLKGLGIAWEQIYDDINYAVEGTAYGLDAAATAAAQLSASGVALGDDMKAALRGISGVAAMTNRDFEEIAMVFTSAAGSGRIMGGEITRLSQKGINVAAELGKALGVTENEVREMARKGEIDFMTFAKAMDSAFGEHAKDANSTFTGAMSNIKAALSKVGATFWTPILTEMVEPLNRIREAINVVKDALIPLGAEGGRYFKVIQLIAKATSKLFVDTAEYLKQVDLIGITDGIFNAFDALLSVLRPLGWAFKAVFPVKSVETVNELIKKFNEFTKSLILTRKESKELQKVFRGIFSAFDIVFKIVKSGINALGRLLGHFTPITDGLGDIVVALANAITTLDLFIGDADVFGLVLDKISEALNSVKLAFEKTFGKKVDISVAGGIGDALKMVADKIRSITIDTEALSNVIDTVLGKAKSIFEKIATAVGIIADGVWNIFQDLFSALTKIDTDKLMKALATGSIVTLLQALSNYFSAWSSSIRKFSYHAEGLTKWFGLDGFFNTITDTFRATTSAIKELSVVAKTQLQLASIKEIAKSILILSAAMYILSTIDHTKVLQSIGAITVLFAELFGGTGIFTKFVTADSIANITKATIAMIPMSIALLLCATALSNIAKLNTQDIVQGIVGMGAIFAALYLMTLQLNKLQGSKLITKSGKFSTKFSTGLMETAKSLIVLAVALNLMVFAVKGLGNLNIEELTKGLAGLAALMLIVYEFCKHVETKIEPASFSKVAGSLILLATSMYIFYKAAKGFASMSWEELGKGLGSLAALLLALGIFVKKLDGAQNSMMQIGATMILIAISLKLLVKTMQSFASMSWEELGKAFVGLLAALVPMYAVIKQLSKMTPEQLASASLGVKGILELSIALLLVSAAFNKLAGIGVTEAITSFIALDGTLAIMLVLIYRLSKFTAEDLATAMIGVKGIVELSIALLLVSSAFKKLSGINTTEAEVAFLALNGTLVVMAGLIKFLSTFSAEKMAVAMTGVQSIILLSASLYIVASSIKKLAGIPLDQSLPAAIMLGTVLAAMTAVVYILATMQGPMMANALLGSASILVLSLSLGKIAKALVALSAVDFGRLEGSVLVLAEVMLLLVATMYAVGANAAACLAGVGVLLAAILGIEVALGLAVLIIAKLVKTISEFVDALDKLTSIDPDKIVASMNALATGFAAFGETMVILGEHLIKAASARKSIKKIAEAIEILAPALVVLEKVNTDKITSSMSAIADGFETFGDAIKVLGEHFILASSARKTISTIADAISKLAPAVKTMSTIPVADMVIIMDTIASTFKKFGETIESVPFWAPNNRAKAIDMLCDSVGKLTSSLPAIADIPSGQFKTVMDGLGEGFKKFGESLSNAPFWGVEERGKAIDILVDDVKKLVDVFPKLRDIDSTELATNMEAIGKAFTELGRSLQSAPMFNADDRGEGIAILVDKIGVLSDGVDKFKNIDESLNDKTLTHIGDAFGQLGTALRDAPLFGAADRGEGVAILVDSLETLANGVKAFSNNFEDVTTLSTITASIGDAFSTLGTSLQSAPLFGAADRGEGIGILVDKISDLAKGLHAFDEFEDTDRLTTIMTAIGDAFLSLGHSLRVAPMFSPSKRAESMVTLLNSTNLLTDAVHKFNDIDDMDRITTIMTAIGNAFVALGKSISSTPFWNATGKAEALVSVVESVDVLVEALRKIMWVNDDTLTNAATYIKDTLSMLGDSMDLFANHEYTTEQINDSVNGVNSIIDMLKNMANAGDIATTGESFNSAIESIATSNIQGIIDAFMGCDAKLQTAVGHLVDIVVKTVTNNKERMIAQGNNIVTWVITGVSDKKDDITKTGQLIVTWIKNAIIGEKLEVISKTKTMMSWIIDTINDYQDELTTCGKNIVLWLNDGINDETSRTTLNNSVTTMMGTVCSNIRDAYDDIYSAGSYLVDGLSDGISDNIKKVAEAAAAMAKAAKKAAKDELDEHSPSKEFYKIGDFADEGAANGISENTYKVTDAIKQTMQRVKDIAEDEGRLTVRPVLDLTDVKTGLRSIEDMFDAHQTIELAASIGTDTNNDGKIQANEGGVVNNITFNQTNNSPKALNRTEIYRQTRNQISQIKGVVRA